MLQTSASNSSNSTENNTVIELGAMVAKSSNDINIFTKNEGADTLVIKANGQQFSMYAANYGKNEINTDDDNDSIIITNLVSAHDGRNTISGGAGDDDIIKLSQSELSFEDVFIDGGESASSGIVEMDVLLTNEQPIGSIWHNLKKSRLH